MKLRSNGKVDDVSQALADPFTRARVNTRIESFRVRGVRMLPLNIAAALADAGLDVDAAEILVRAVVARIGERVSPIDDPTLPLGRSPAASIVREPASWKSTRVARRGA